MKQDTHGIAASMAEVQTLINKWPSLTEEQIAEYKELGVTKRKLQNKIIENQEFLAKSSVPGEGKLDVSENIQYETMWTDMRSYIEDIILDLERHTNMIPELTDMINFYKTSMVRIEKKPTQVLKRLSAQLMTQLYNLNLSTFLDKHSAKKAAEDDELAPDSVGIEKQGEASEQEKESARTRARYTIKSFGDEDIVRCDEMLISMGFDPDVFKTVAAKCVVARFSFRNNLSYLKSESELARSVSKNTIAGFKEFQNEHFVSWAGAENNGTSRLRTVSFFSTLINLWEAKNYADKRNVNNQRTCSREALVSLEKAKSFGTEDKNILAEIAELTIELTENSNVKEENAALF